MTDTPTRTAIVTGAARGIGAATARRLARDGFAVAVLDLDEDACGAVVDEITSAGGQAAAIGADVGSEESVAAAVERVAALLGAPTVLINNAGITRDNLLFKMSLAEWDSVMSVHLRGGFLMCRATQKYMVEAKWGRVVNLSSISALGNRGQVNYSAAKAGLQGFTKTLAIELGPFGVTANAIAPGFVESDIDTAPTASSSSSTSPEVGKRRPAAMSMRVVLPAPLGPSTTHRCPSSTCSDTRESRSELPRRTVTSLITTTLGTRQP